MEQRLWPESVSTSDPRTDSRWQGTTRGSECAGVFFCAWVSCLVESRTPFADLSLTSSYSVCGWCFLRLGCRFLLGAGSGSANATMMGPSGSLIRKGRSCSFERKWIRYPERQVKALCSLAGRYYTWSKHNGLTGPLEIGWRCCNGKGP